MPVFGTDDFKGDTLIKLSVILMPTLGKPSLFGFSQLTDLEKQRFNKKMNKYIANLGENWEDTLNRDFNEVCRLDSENIFNGEKMAIKDTDMEIKLLT